MYVNVPHTEDLKHRSAHAWVTLASWRRRALFSNEKAIGWHLGLSENGLYVPLWTCSGGKSWVSPRDWVFHGMMMNHYSIILLRSWSLGVSLPFRAWFFSISLLSYSSWSTEDYIFKYASRMRQKLQDYRSLLEGMCLCDISGKRWHGDVGWQWCWTGTKTRHFMTNQYVMILHVGISCLIWWYHMFTIWKFQYTSWTGNM